MTALLYKTVQRLTPGFSINFKLLGKCNKKVGNQTANDFF